MTLKPFVFAMSAATLSLSTLETAHAGPSPAPNGPQAVITMRQARAIALKTLPGGTIADSELEKEKGGSGVRYSFDVKYHGKTYEVGVDANTGKVLENSVEGANPD